MQKTAFSFLFILLIWVISCRENEPNRALSDDELILAHIDSLTDYFDSLGVEVAQDTSGIWYYPLTLNPGGKSQSEGTVLSFHYQMSVLGGALIDQVDSADADTLIGRRGVSAIYPIGVDRALARMKEGEEWVFFIPSSLGFGAYSYSTLIPENAILELRLKLLKIQTEDDILTNEIRAINQYIEDKELRDTVANPLNLPRTLPNGLVYKRLSAGQAGTRAINGQDVTVTFEGRFLNDERFTVIGAAAPLVYTYGSQLVIAGLDIGIGQMEIGERALLIMPSYLAYRSSALVLPQYLTGDMVEREIVPAYAENVGPYEPLVFEIHFIDAE